MIEVLNVPNALLQEYVKRNQLDVLAYAIIIKKTYGNSIAYNFSYKKAVSLFHVCPVTAYKIIAKIKKSDLFVYNGKNHSVFVKSFKSDNFRTYGTKRKFISNSDYCLKFDVDIRGKSSHDVVVMLRKSLLTREIDVPRRESLKKHLLQCGEPYVPEPVTLSMLKGTINMSKSSTGRLVNELVKEGKVNKSKIVVEVVLPYYDESKLSEWQDYKEQHPHTYTYKIQNNAVHYDWILAVKGRRLTLTDDSYKNCFKNVIYKHPRRINTLSDKTRNEVESYCGMPDGFYDTDVKERRR